MLVPMTAVWPPAILFSVSCRRTRRCENRTVNSAYRLTRCFLVHLEYLLGRQIELKLNPTRGANRAPGTIHACKSFFPEEINLPIGFKTELAVL